MFFKKKLNKKGMLNGGGINGSLLTILSAVVIMSVIGIVTAFSQDVTEDVSADFTNDSYAANATLSAQEASAELTGELPTVSKIIIAVFIISLLVGGFLGAVYSRR